MCALNVYFYKIVKTVEDMLEEQRLLHVLTEEQSRRRSRWKTTDNIIIHHNCFKLWVNFTITVSFKSKVNFLCVVAH